MRKQLAAALIALTCVSVPGGPAKAAETHLCSSGIGHRQPVLLVHGYNSGPETWSAATQKTLAGTKACVQVFDYKSVSTNWVTDQRIGPNLADAINVLADASKKAGGPGKVVIVAHSMGGLAVRCAVAPSCSTASGDVAHEIAALVTFDTPNKGTFLKGYGVSDVTDLLGPLLSAGCSAGSVLLRFLSCDEIKALGTSAAAKAFTPGSAQLRALPVLPSSIPVMAVAGSVKLVTSWWNRGDKVLGDAGDLIVNEDSALAEARTIGGIGGQDVVGCGDINFGNLGVQAKNELQCTHVGETNNDGFLVDAVATIGKVIRQGSQIVLTKDSVAGVPFGTSTAEGTATLTALLGKPQVFDGGCDLGSPASHTRTLTWGSFSVTFSDTTDQGQRVATQQLAEWDLGKGPSRFSFSLPQGIGLGTPLSTVERLTGKTPMPTFDDSVVEIYGDNADYAFSVSGAGGVQSIGRGGQPCE